jgi:hypothetical protein
MCQLFNSGCVCQRANIAAVWYPKGVTAVRVHMISHNGEWSEPCFASSQVR